MQSWDCTAADNASETLIKAQQWSHQGNNALISENIVFEKKLKSEMNTEQ